MRVETNCCDVSAEGSDKLRIKLESGAEDIVLSRRCKISAHQDGKLAIVYDCTDLSVTSSIQHPASVQDGKSLNVDLNYNKH